jgi:hypothetical protein
LGGTSGKRKIVSNRDLSQLPFFEAKDKIVGPLRCELVGTNTTRKNIFVAWDRMNSIWFRYWANYEEKGKTLNGETSREHQKKFEREVQFLVRGSCDLEFHQYLNKRLDYTKEKGRKEGLVVRRHIRELTRFILSDKLRQKDGRFATTQDILSSKKDNSLWWRENANDRKDKKRSCDEDTEQLSYGHLHRMVNEYYPELVTTRIELRGRLGKRKYLNGRKIDDHRERIVETQFSQVEKIPPGIFELVVARAMREKATPKFLKQMHYQADEVAKLMICDPIDLAKLVAFRDDVLKIIDELSANPFTDEKKAEKQKAFTESDIFNYLIESLFLQVRALVELRWFKEKSERVQDNLIFREPQLPKYNRVDAKKAVNLSLQWFREPESVLALMEFAALTYSRYLREAMPKIGQVGLWLNQECLLQLDLPDHWKANAYYNVAIGYWEIGQQRLMLRWLRESLSIYARIGGHPGDEADAYGYVAEYWRLRDSKKYVFNRNKAEELVKNGTLTKRRKAFHYLFLSNCALMHQDVQWEKRLYELGLVLSGNDASLEDFAFFFNQCLNDLEAFGKRGPEGGPGRFAPPKEWDERRPSPSFKMTFVDPDAGN